MGTPATRKPPFRYAVYTRVAFSDTDAQGVVYYGRYLPYFDLARTEYHRQLGAVGVERSEFVMRASEVEYLAPARFDDLLEVFVRVSRIGRTSVSYLYAAHHVGEAGSDALLVTASQTLVLIDHTTRRTVVVPELFHEAVSRSRARRAETARRWSGAVHALDRLGRPPIDVDVGVIAERKRLGQLRDERAQLAEELARARRDRAPRRNSRRDPVDEPEAS